MELWKPVSKFRKLLRLLKISKSPPEFLSFQGPAIVDAKSSNPDGPPTLTRPLSAYNAPRPPDVKYENLAGKFSRIRKARRCCSSCALVCILFCSMAIALLAVTAETMASTYATRLHVQSFELVTEQVGVSSAFSSLSTNSASSTGANETGSGVDGTIGSGPVALWERGPFEMGSGIASGFECEEEDMQLVYGHLSDPIGLIGELSASNGAGLSEGQLELLVALLSCWAVPAMQCTPGALGPLCAKPS